MIFEGNLTPVQPARHSCYERLVRSKWVDVALIAGGIALLTIGILSSLGIFNFIGTTQAQYLAYGAYAGSALLFALESVKLVLGCILRSKSPPPPEPLTRQELDAINKEKSELLKKFEGRQIFDEPIKDIVEQSINKVLSDQLFLDDPVRFMDEWKQKRGGTHQHIVGQDDAHRFFRKEIGKIRAIDTSTPGLLVGGSRPKKANRFCF